MIRRYIHPAEPVYQVQPPRPGVLRIGVDVGGEEVGFDLVTRDRGLGVAVADGVDEVEQFPGAIGAAQGREGP